MCSNESQTKETAGLIYWSAELCFHHAKLTGQQRKWEVHITTTTWYNESLPFLLSHIKDSNPVEFSLDVWGSVALEEHAGRDWEGRHVSPTLPLVLCLSLCTEVKLKKKTLSAGNRSHATQMVPSLYSNGMLSHCVLPVSSTVQTIMLAPAFLPLSLFLCHTNTCTHVVLIV